MKYNTIVTHIAGIKEFKMAIKKQGTTEKISLLTESELTTLRRLISKALELGIEPSEIFLETKPKKEKK